MKLFFGREEKEIAISESKVNLQIGIVVNGKIVHSIPYSEENSKIQITYNGELVSLDCTNSVVNGNVNGPVDSTNLRCGNITGDVDSTNVTCENIKGDVDSMNVRAVTISGDVDATVVNASSINM